eukprot:gene6246-7239_t
MTLTIYRSLIFKRCSLISTHLILQAFESIETPLREMSSLPTLVLGVLAVVVAYFWYPIAFILYVGFIFSAIALSDVIMTVSMPLLLFSSNYFRKLTNGIAQLGWPLFTVALEFLGKNKLVFSGDDIRAYQTRDRSALVTLNHTYYCDWMLAFSLGERTGRIGNIKIAMKDIIKYVPFVGVGIWAMGFIFLSRSWQNDQPKINKAFSRLKKDGEPFWFVTHPEGSRMSAANLKDSRQFAMDRGGNVPLLDNILVPRVKGFTTAVQATRDVVDVVYDMTAAYKRPPRGFLGLLYGANPTEVHIHLRRYPITDVPTSDADASAWLYARYKEKDELLAHFKEKGHFPGKTLDYPFNARKYLPNFVMWLSAVGLFIYTTSMIIG